MKRKKLAVKFLGLIKFEGARPFCWQAPFLLIIAIFYAFLLRELTVLRGQKFQLVAVGPVCRGGGVRSG